MRSKLTGLAAVLFLGLAACLRADPTPADTATVPLTLVQLSNGDYKLGISIALGGGPAKLYEFDTGASGFYAANNTAWWPSYTTTNSTIINQSFSSGIDYNATTVSTTLDFGYGVPIVTANIGQIQTASGSKVPNWTTDVAADIPPLYTAFFGDFGSALVEKNGIFAVLPQLSGNFANGIIVRTGGFGNPTPTLQIGITDADRALFPYAAPMQGGSNTTVFPGSGLDTYAQQLLTGNASFFNGTQTVNFATGYVLDTGAPTMALHDDGNVTVPSYFYDGDYNIDVGVNTTISAGNFTYSFLAGNVIGLNQINVDPDTKGYINQGLIPFFQYDVMFDVQQGYVRFAPITVPEPGTTALAMAAGVSAFLVFRRRRSNR